MQSWSTLLHDVTVISRNPPSAESPLKLLPNGPRFINLPRPYIDKGDTALGRKFLCYLQYTLHQLQSHSTKGHPIAYELAELKASPLLFSEGAEFFTNGRRNPIGIGEDNHTTDIRLLCRSLRFLLRTCTWLHKVSIKWKEFADAYATVVCIMSTLLESIVVDMPARVQHMVESGVVKTPVKSAGSFYRLGEEGTDGIRGIFQEHSVRLIDRIALLIVHRPRLMTAIRDEPQMWENAMVSYGMKHSGLLDKA
ncbi:hypothetical protein AAF712_011755 [Marasmius tenuissimus]|uniref:Uncharacterized protein n=1 Tax=Marasmius tenuissimus TaxID=585030 RepID=A0ABR2ZK74_9AGAR